MAFIGMHLITVEWCRPGLMDLHYPTLSWLLEALSNVPQCITIDQIRNEPVRCAHKSASIPFFLWKSQVRCKRRQIRWLQQRMTHLLELMGWQKSFYLNVLCMWLGILIIRPSVLEASNRPFDCLDSSCQCFPQTADSSPVPDFSSTTVLQPRDRPVFALPFTRSSLFLESEAQIMKCQLVISHVRVREAILSL